MLLPPNVWALSLKSGHRGLLKPTNVPITVKVLNARRVRGVWTFLPNGLRALASSSAGPSKKIDNQPRQIRTQKPSTSATASAHLKSPQTNAYKNVDQLRPPSSQELVYPASLLIYHAGTPRTTFLAVVKLTSIFIFVFGSLLLAPPYFLDPSETIIPGAVIVGGSAIPLIFMTMTTAPFVTYVHLVLPTWARASQTRLIRYAQNLPSTAIMDVTTLRWIWPRVTRLRAGELYFEKGKLGGPLTLKREIPKEVWSAKRWYDWRPLKKFFVGGTSKGQVREAGVWEEVVSSISRGWQPQLIKSAKVKTDVQGKHVRVSSSRSTFLRT